MKTCDDFRESLGAWLDGELNRAEAEGVRSHIENCAACGEERRQLESLNDLLKRGFEEEVPRVKFGVFWRGVRQRIGEERAWHEEFRERAQAFFTPPRLAWGIPVLIVVLLAALSMDSLVSGWRSGVQQNNFAAVDSIDAYGRNVALLREDETKTTVIWLYQNQEGDNEASADNPDPKPSF